MKFFTKWKKVAAIKKTLFFSLALGTEAKSSDFIKLCFFKLYYRFRGRKVKFCRDLILMPCRCRFNIIRECIAVNNFRTNLMQLKKKNKQILVIKCFISISKRNVRLKPENFLIHKQPIKYSLRFQFFNHLRC